MAYPVSFEQYVRGYEQLFAENKRQAKEIERLKGSLEAIKGLTHFHYTVCGIDDQSEDEIAEFIEQALSNE